MKKNEYCAQLTVFLGFIGVIHCITISKPDLGAEPPDRESYAASKNIPQLLR